MTNETTNKATTETWLLLRGLLREQGHWGDFPAQLQQRLPDTHIITLDIPGNGLKYREQSPISIPKMVDALRSEYASSQPLNILSLSMGGMIATNWMQRFPHEVSKSVLINTSLKSINPLYQRLRPSNYLKLLSLLSQSHDNKEHTLLKLTANNFHQRQNTLNDWQDIARSRPVSKQNIIRQLFAASRFSPQEEPPIQPILLINSLHDRLVNSGCSNDIALTWKKTLISHPTAGHDIPLDDPEWTINQVKGWLASLKNDSSIN